MADEERVVIRARKDGPYLVTGDVQLLDTDGQEWDTSGKKNIALCRCGASQTKPFCDGTHSKLGFEAAEQAVREEEAKKK